MQLKGNFGQVQRVAVVSMRCPNCGQMGTFNGVVQFDAAQSPSPHGYIAGMRQCPNPQCHALVFVICDNSGSKILASYPTERLGFDKANIPEVVAHALEEAIVCHANACYVASAIMVRKTLEALCQAQGAVAVNLKGRLQKLGEVVVLPKELFDGLDDLRILGNDAAHVESQAFERIGQAEVETAIEFTKEILKAVYQYRHLLTKLQQLRRGTSAN